MCCLNYTDNQFHFIFYSLLTWRFTESEIKTETDLVNMDDEQVGSSHMKYLKQPVIWRKPGRKKAPYQDDKYVISFVYICFVKQGCLVITWGMGEILA